MFHYIKGELALVEEDYVVIDNNDIGYKINTSQLSIANIRDKKEKIIMYTAIIHRDDDMSMYGFSTQEELKMFQLLTTVSGIGAKVAVGILSSIPIMDLVGMIITEDIQGLIKAQGVGKKTAQRMILELKDKVDSKMAAISINTLPKQNNIANDDEVISALLALGYSRNEADIALRNVKDKNLNIEELIKRALKFLVK